MHILCNGNDVAAVPESADFVGRSCAPLATTCRLAVKVEVIRGQ